MQLCAIGDSRVYIITYMAEEEDLVDERTFQTTERLIQSFEITG
jgi:hypothetical protein